MIRRWAGTVATLVFALIIVIPSGFRIAAAWRETADASELAPATGRYVEVRSGRMFVQEAGPPDGMPVVLFHGTAAWSEFWRRTTSALAAEGFRVIALDIPPFGFSDRPRDHAYSRAAQAERVHDVLDRLEIGKAMLVGHSFGAGATVETVLRYPERIAGLVLVDAALGLSADAGSSLPLYLRPHWTREIAASLTVTNPLATRTLLSMMIAKKEGADDENVAILQRPIALRNTTREMATWLGYFMSADSGAWSADRARYATIAAPTAIIWGNEDTVTPVAQAEDLRSLIPGATLTLLPHLGHIPHIEDPDAFNRALIERLRALM